MRQWLQDTGLASWLSAELALELLKAAITLLVGLVLARLVSSALGRILSKHVTVQAAVIMRRMSFYILGGLVVVSALNQAGFNLGVLLGAAGVLTVALGFASQTSASNLISGLFLIAERPFAIGDVIRVSDITGEVLSIDLLSVKLRTMDNLYVRVPNEELIKSRIVNVTHFPIRRVDIKVGVAYKEDLSRVKRLLFEAAERNPLCLDEPVPAFTFMKFGDSAIECEFSVWALRENYLIVNNSIQEEIKKVFDAAGIEMPYPHRTLYAGSVTEPFPVRVVEAGSS